VFSHLTAASRFTWKVAGNKAVGKAEMSLLETGKVKNPELYWEQETSEVEDEDPEA
jgi:hypothetical protein